MAETATPSEQQFNLIVSQRGNPQVIHEGYSYSKYIELFNTGEVGWRCTVKTCKAKVYTLGSIINRTSSNEHSHLPLDEESLNRRAAKNFFKQIERTKESRKSSRKDYSDADNAGDDDDSSYLDNMGGGGGQIEIDVDVDPAFETVDIKPLIVHGEVQPQPQTTKRKRNSDPLDPSATSSKRSTPLKKKLLCDFGDEGNEDDDDEPDYGDDFDSEEDSAKVRRAYELLKSVFDKKDKYDLFCDRLAGRLRALQSPKVCRHVQQILVTAVADAEAGKFDNI